VPIRSSRWGRKSKYETLNGGSSTRPAIFCLKGGGEYPAGITSFFPREGPASKRYARALFEDYKISEILTDFALF
jgi:hypothetical protein